jgi:hypothetical protein
VFFFSLPALLSSWPIDIPRQDGYALQAVYHTLRSCLALIVDEKSLALRVGIGNQKVTISVKACGMVVKIHGELVLQLHGIM